MDEFRTKTRWTWNYFQKLVFELLCELWNYYVNPFPVLLILGTLRRFRRRMRIIWRSKKPKGRPPIHENIVDLIIEMKRANWLWGAQRISDELKIMGISVSKKTVLKILKDSGYLPPKTKFSPPTWRSLLNSYKRYWAIDFTTVFDSSGIQLFILGIIEIPSRKLVLINVTANPSKEWIIQQFRNTFPNEFPAAILHDRDGIYGQWLPGVLEEFGSKSIQTQVRSPWQNGVIERFHLSLKNEVLDRVILHDAERVRELCASYQSFYNRLRPHQGIAGQIPSRQKSDPNKVIDFGEIRIKKVKVLDGLVTHFRIAA